MEIDWNTLLVPKVSILELVLRGTAVYFTLFAMLRVLARRHVGAFSIVDLLVIVLVADAAQNAMASEYRSLPEGIALCVTLIGGSYVLDRLAFRYEWIRKCLERSPLPLICNSQLLRKNMRQELVSLEELQSHLREHEGGCQRMISGIVEPHWIT